MAEGRPAAKVDAKKKHFNPHDDSFVSRYLRADEYIPLSEIKPGMEGYGLSVFQGTKVEKFQVKVIGVIKQVLNGRDAILIRISGAVLGKNNVVRGMSGSPIYLNGRLAGALSYGFDFSKEPIVGVTPVVDMLDALTFDDSERDRHISLNLHDLHRRARPTAVPVSVPTGGGILHMSPLMAPVSLAGYSTRAQEYLKERLRDSGLAVSTGATGGLDSNLAGHAAHEHIPPGASVALMLSTGDFASAATGTATCQFGNKIVAFGHSFMDAGQVAFPMATAYVHEVLPSLSVSFKLASPIQVVGTVFADRPWSIGGEVGRYCQMIPLTISVTDESRHVKKTYNCKLVDDPELTPSLVTATIMSALDSTYQSQDPHVIKVATEMELKDHRKISRNDRFAVNFPAHASGEGHLKVSSDPVSGFVGGLVDKVVDNDYERAKLSKLNVDVVVDDGRKVSRIERIYLDRSTVAPGDTVVVNCALKPFGGERIVEKLNFTVPRDTPDTDLAIGVSGGDELDNIRKRLGLADPQPETLKQIIAKIIRKERGDTLCGVMALTNQSVAVDGEVLKNPPAQWLKLLFSDRSTRVPTLLRGEERARLLSDNLIDGSHIIAVTVRRKDKIFARPLPYSVNPQQSAHPSDGVYITEQAKKAIEAGRKTETASGTAAATPAATATSSTSSEKNIPAWTQAQSYPHMRVVSLWRQDSEESFRSGYCDGVAVDSQGRLHPGYRELSRHGLDGAHIWAGAINPKDGNFYAALENSIVRYQGGNPEVVAKLPGLIVSALAINSKGEIFAASAPGSEIYRVDGHELKPVCKVSESIVSALTCDHDNLYIGTCGSGRVYTLNTVSGKSAEPLCDSGQAHITALNFCEREHKLYIGTAEKGCVYSVEGNKLKAEFESGEHIVTGVARDNSGNLFVSTAGAGKLIRVMPSGQIDVVATSEAFYTMHYDSRSDHVYCGDAEGDITRVEIDSLTDQARFLPVCHTEQEAVNALDVWEGKLYCGTSNNAQLRSFALAAGADSNSQANFTGSPIYESPVHDAGRTAVWSRLRLADSFGQSNDALNRLVRVETRSGESSQPDPSWSQWNPAALDVDGYGLKSPAARYLQYRLVWKLDKMPRQSDLLVSRVDTTFQASNQLPSFSVVSLKNGDSLSDTVSVTVTGGDQDADNLALSLDLSDDSGKTWKTLVSDLRSRPDKEAEKLKKKGKDESKDASRESGDSATSKDTSKDASKDSSKEAAKEPVKESVKDENNSSHGAQDSKEKGADKEKLKDSADQSGPKENKSSKEIKENKDGKGHKEVKDGKDSKDGKDGKDGKDSKDSKDSKENKDSKDAKEKSEKPKAETETKTSEQLSQTEKFTYSFETKKIKDGRYLVRLTLSDAPSNRVQALNCTAYRSITVDNTAPKIGLKVDTATRGKCVLTLQVDDELSGAADAVYKLEGQEPYAFVTVGENKLLNDSRSVSMTSGEIVLPTQGGKKVTIQAYDRAGNCAKKTVNLP